MAIVHSKERKILHSIFDGLNEMTPGEAIKTVIYRFSQGLLHGTVEIPPSQLDHTEAPLSHEKTP